MKSLISGKPTGKIKKLIGQLDEGIERSYTEAGGLLYLDQNGSPSMEFFLGKGRWELKADNPDVIMLHVPEPDRDVSVVVSKGLGKDLDGCIWMNGRKVQFVKGRPSDCHIGVCSEEEFNDGYFRFEVHKPAMFLKTHLKKTLSPTMGLVS